MTRERKFPRKSQLSPPLYSVRIAVRWCRLVLCAICRLFRALSSLFGTECLLACTSRFVSFLALLMAICFQLPHRHSDGEYKVWDSGGPPVVVEKLQIARLPSPDYTLHRWTSKKFDTLETADSFSQSRTGFRASVCMRSSKQNSRGGSGTSH